MNIYQYFGNSLSQFPGRLALVVDEHHYTYRELAAIVDSVGNVVAECENPFIGLFGHRSMVAYAGVLGILKAGKAYVPMNPKFPASRNLQIMTLTGIDTLVVGKECINALKSLAEVCSQALTLVFPDLSPEQVPLSLRDQHNCIFIDPDLKVSFEIRTTGSDDFAYMLFTSGSTGVPKGVPISHGNVRAYVDYQKHRYAVNETDRFSQTFDLTFDLSVHDLFLCWSAGAALYSIPESELLMPARFIAKNQLTMWFSVPSLCRFMSRFRLLKPNAFPSLRFSLFCGEPLPATVATQWQEAAVNSVLENIYGPTEATIGITHYTLPAAALIKAHNGIVSIGKIFNTQRYCVLNEEGHLAPAGKTGELCLGGSQLCSGYWRNPAKTMEQFIEVEALDNTRFYRTGDMVKVDEEGDIYFVARKDLQVKIKGYRVELEEINHVIGRFLGTDQVFSIPFPVSDGIAENVYAFVDRNFSHRKKEIIPHVASLLPEYMTPRSIIFVESLPLNSNGKIDRLALTAMLEVLQNSENLD